MNRNFQVILFDFGDTLIYSTGDWNEIQIRASKALWQALQEEGLKLNPDQFLSFFLDKMRKYYLEREENLVEYTSQKVLEDSLAEIGYKNLNHEITRHALDSMYRVTQKHWHLENDSISTLKWLKENNYHIGLTSNASDTKDVMELLTIHGIAAYLEMVLVSAGFGLRKPHPAIFKEALNFFSAKPDECMMVGDKLASDIKGANQSGITSVWISRRGQTAYNKKHLHIKPDFEIQSLSQLPAILQTLEEN